MGGPGNYINHRFMLETDRVQDFFSPDDYILLGSLIVQGKKNRMNADEREYLITMEDFVNSISENFTVISDSTLTGDGTASDPLSVNFTDLTQDYGIVFNSPLVYDAGAGTVDIDNSALFNIYNSDGSTGGGTRTATIGDRLDFLGVGGNLNFSSGNNAGGFGVAGTVTNLTTAGISGYYSVYDLAGNAVIDQRVYGGTAGDQAGILVGPYPGVSTFDTYGSIFWTPDSINYNGFEANEFGEQIYSQRNPGAIVTPIAANDRMAFINDAGYIKTADWNDILTNLGAVTENIYIADSQFTGNRLADLDGFDLSFQNGQVAIGGPVSGTDIFRVIGDTTIALGDFTVGTGRVGINGTATAGSESILLRRFTTGEDVIKILGGAAGNLEYYKLDEDGYSTFRYGGIAVNSAQTNNYTSIFRGNSSDTYAMGVLSSSGNSITFTSQMLGSTTQTGISVGVQSNPTGLNYGVNANIGGTNASKWYAINGISRNASQDNIGVSGTVQNNTQFGTGINAGVQGVSITLLDGQVSYGGYFTNGPNTALDTRTGVDFVGLRSRGLKTGDGSGSASIRTIGAIFEAQNGTTVDEAIALLVPATLNDGNVVFGADSSSVNASMLEVTGDIEVLGGSGNGVIITSPDTTRWKIQVDNGGSLSAVLA